MTELQNEGIAKIARVVSWTAASRWLLGIIFVAVLSSACTSGARSPQGADPLLEVETARQLLLEDQVLMFVAETSSPDPTVLPFGFTLEGRYELPSSSSAWCRAPREDPVEIGWEMLSHGSSDVVFFSIFTSNGSARKAWHRLNDSLPCGYELDSINRFDMGSMRLPTQRFAARLINGSVPTKEQVFGFSTTQVLLGNIIIHVRTYSNLSPSGASPHSAIDVTERIVTFISERTCPAINPC